MEVDRSITADRLVEVLERLVALHGPTRHLRVDKGPEMLAWALRDWCRLGGDRHHLHRTRQPRGEPLRRVVQRPRQRRAAQHRRVRQPARGPGGCRGVADRVQHLPAPLVAGRVDARRVQAAVDRRKPAPVLITSGSGSGAPSYRGDRDGVDGTWFMVGFIVVRERSGEHPTARPLGAGIALPYGMVTMVRTERTSSSLSDFTALPRYTDHPGPCVPRHRQALRLAEPLVARMCASRQRL
jgi:hypothetical protein